MFSFPTDNFRSPGALARFFLTMLVGLGLDLGTKAWAWNSLVESTRLQSDGRVEVTTRTHVEFIPGWLHFSATANQGAVFGMGQGRRALFVGVSVLAVLFLSYLFAQSGRRRFYQFVLGMLLAGVLGNMYDRVRFGYVRDMIYILPEWDVFPWIFNIADVLLCTGVGLMVLYSLVERREDHQTARVAGEEA